MQVEISFPAGGAALTQRGSGATQARVGVMGL